MIEMLPEYEIKINELVVTGQDLAKNSKNKQESGKFLDESETLQNDFKELRQSLQSAKSK